MRWDLRDILELDCNERLLLDEPDYLINEWIRRSTTVQSIILDVEAMFNSEVWSEQIQHKKVNKHIVRGLYDDFLEDPRSFKYDLLWSLDGTTMLHAIWYMIQEPTLGQHIWETYDKLDEDPTIKELVEILEAKEISGPIFREFLHEKNGVTQEVSCLRIEHLDDAVDELTARHLPSQLLLEYVDKDAAAASPVHDDIVQLRIDLIDTLELDCNERLLRDEPHTLINEWMLRSNVLQEMILQIEEVLEQPEIERIQVKLLSDYMLEKLISDLRTETNRHDLLVSIQYLFNLEHTNTLFKAAEAKVYADTVYIEHGDFLGDQ